MLDTKLFIEGIQDLVDFYPTWSIRVEDKNVVKKWYEMFKNIDDDTFNKMVAEHIKTVKFNPTVASLLELKTTIKINSRYVEL